MLLIFNLEVIMGGWIFMLCMVLLIPLTMIIWGKYSINNEVKGKIDISKYRRKSQVRGEKEWLYLSGYRTRRSMKNDKTFKFAQKLFGKWCYRLGIIIIIPSILSMFFVLGKDKNTISWTGLAVVAVQMIVMMMPIIPVERALKNNFDKDGNRLNK